MPRLGGAFFCSTTILVCLPGSPSLASRSPHAANPRLTRGIFLAAASSRCGRMQPSNPRDHPMQKLLLIGAALGLVAVSLPAHADDEVPSLPAYVEADIGHASLDRSGVSPTPAQTSGISGTTTTGTLLGGYFFTDNF